MLAGSSGSERSTASPRKTCVPGVHANAGAGNIAMATRAIATGPAIAIAWGRQPVGPRLTLYAEALALTPNCLAQVAKLRLHHIGNRLARRVERVSELFADGLHRHTVP